MIEFITELVIGIEVYLLILIILEFIYGKKEPISKNDFNKALKYQELIQGKNKKYNNLINQWITKISYTIGKNQNIETIDKLIKSIFIQRQNKFTLFSNLGPAVGLFFTFLGMIITIWYIGVTKIQSINQVKDAISHLYPVFVGSLLGIFVYGIGITLKRKFDVFLEKISDSYLSIYIEVEKDSQRKIPSDIREAYQQLLLSFSELKEELNSIRLGFKDFSNELKQNNEQFESNVKKIEQTNKQFIEGINTSSENVINSSLDLLEITGDYNNTFAQLSEKIKSYNTTLEQSSSKLSELMDSGNEFIDSFKKAKETISLLLETSNSLKDVSDSFFKNKDDIEKLTNQFDKYLLEVKELLQLQTSIKISFEQFNSKLPPEEVVNMSLYIKEIAENINNFNELENKLHKYIDNNDGKLRSILDLLSSLKNDYSSIKPPKRTNDGELNSTYKVKKSEKVTSDITNGHSVNNSPDTKGDIKGDSLSFKNILIKLKLKKRNKNER